MKSSPPRLRLRITATAESILRGGHPWLFDNSIREQNREGELGELAIVFDRKDKFLAVGLFDPDSPIRLRVLHSGKPASINRDWWQKNLQQTLTKRKGLFDKQTNGYRCINGESDGWPGFVLDRYDKTFVLKIYTAAWFPHLAEIIDLLNEEFSNSVLCQKDIAVTLVLRLSRNIQKAAEKFKLCDGQILRGTPDSKVVFLENGLRFEADVLRGQKTGFFLDQRENRRTIESFASGRTVLNAFSFSGGFSLYAARGGAISVTDLDISAHALAGSERNFALNLENQNVARCPHEMIQADAFEWLQNNPNRRFDLVILDPPSLAKRESERTEAILAYGKLAAGGISHLLPGGILVAASCSSHVSAEEFLGAVRQAAQSSRRAFEELKTTRHAPDHPTNFKEAEYLKCIYLKFSS